MRHIIPEQTIEQMINIDPSVFTFDTLVDHTIMSTDFWMDIDDYDVVFIRYNDPNVGMLIISLVKPLVKLIDSDICFENENKTEGYAYMYIEMGEVKKKMPIFYQKYCLNHMRIKKIKSL